MFLSSPVGLTIDEAARRALGLPPGRVAQKITADAKESADRVRERMDQDRASPYKVLGVDKEADELVVKAAWKALAKRYHPDKAGGSAEKMKAINEAYSQICKEQEWSK